MKVEDYVRTDYNIGKIIEILQPTDVDEPDLKLDVSDCNDNPYIFKSEVIKSSPNIIDLIEVGDYVNGKKVAVNCKENGGNIVIFTDMDCVNENNIKSILTKEQFSQMEYKVGE